jgi:hypothetical protein
LLRNRRLRSVEQALAVAGHLTGIDFGFERLPIFFISPTQYDACPAAWVEK